MYDMSYLFISFIFASAYRSRVMLTMGTWRDTAALVSQNAVYIRRACEEFRKSDALRCALGWERWDNRGGTMELWGGSYWLMMVHGSWIYIYTIW